MHSFRYQHLTKPLCVALLALSLPATTGCAGDAATRYRGLVLARPAPGYGNVDDAADPQPPIANARVALRVAFAKDPEKYCASLADFTGGGAGGRPSPDVVQTSADGSFEVVTYYGGLWPLPMPDRSYLCVSHPDYEPYAYSAQVHDPASDKGRMLKIYLKRRDRK
jgi:hypothetical protein